MRHLARLALFFSITFIIVFLAATGIQFLSLRVEWVQALPAQPQTVFSTLLEAAHWALSFTMYAVILLSLSYAARKKYSAFMTIFCVTVLSVFFNLTTSYALYTWNYAPPSQVAGIQMGEEGLILSNSLTGNETAVVLLRGTADPLGPRVVSIPDRPLFFLESTANTDVLLPPIPFASNVPWFLQSLFIDIRLSALQLQARLLEGLTYYLIYAGALFFFMSSLGFAIKLSVWPLANLFLGILAFRGILSLETFFNSAEMQEVFYDLSGNIIPLSFAVPFIFIVFGLLINLYMVLVFAAKRRDKDEY